MIHPVSSHTGSGAVAVTPHHEATRAAMRVMGAGGTAADAVIAANAVLGMVLPSTCGIGGDLFALVHKPGMEQPDVLNASGRGGSGLSAASLRAAGHTRMPTYGTSTISVPGCVDGWEALQARYGRLGLEQVLADAITLGEEGFEVSVEFADTLNRLAESLIDQPSAAALYPGAAPPASGATLVRNDLASTLRAIAEDGRAAFYEGDVAATIAAATDGVLNSDDLATNTIDWVDPIGLDIFGLTGWTAPPNSQGYITLAAAWVFEQIGPPADPTDPAFHHALIEAYRAFAWERNDVVADPSHAPWEPAEYLKPERLQQRLREFEPNAITPWPQPTPGPAGTAFFCAVDAEGMAVSCIQSNYFGIGSRISAGTTGVFLHNRAAGFSVIEGHPNEAGPGKRPLHTLSPTLWTRGTEPALILGTRGGDQQPQYLAQMAASLLFAGRDPAQAQAQPRWSLDTAEPGPGSVVLVEPGMPESVVAGLAATGHTVTAGPVLTPGWGPVSVIAVDTSGVRTAAADPRISTASATGD
ncbi:MAG: gamma-glutamyltransferase [Acidimicrobiia bacterium]